MKERTKRKRKRIREKEKRGREGTEKRNQMAKAGSGYTKNVRAGSWLE